MNHVLTFFRVVCVALEFSGIYGDVISIGNSMRPGNDIAREARGAWIDLGSELPTGDVIKWRIFCRVPYKAVRLQIWRPVSREAGVYALFAEHRAVPSSYGIHEYEILPNKRVKVQAGDVLGFTNEDFEGALAMTYTAGNSYVIRSESLENIRVPSGLPAVGDSVFFQTNGLERKYSLSVDIVTCSPLWEVVDLHCARLITDKGTWWKAHDQCLSKGGHLGEPLTSGYSMALRNLMVMRGLSHIWIGAQYDESSDTYRWLQGNVTVNSPPWAPGEPSTTQACISFSIKGEWDVKRCSYLSQYICQNHETISVQTTPSVPYTMPKTSTMAPTVPVPIAPEPGMCHATNTWFTGEGCPSRKLLSRLYQVENSARSLLSDVETLQLYLNQTQTPNKWDRLLAIHLLKDITVNQRNVLKENVTEDNLNSYVEVIGDTASLLLEDVCVTGLDDQTYTGYDGSDFYDYQDSTESNRMKTLHVVENLMTGVMKIASNKTGPTNIHTKTDIMDINIDIKERRLLPSSQFYYYDSPTRNVRVKVPVVILPETEENVGVATMVFETIPSYFPDDSGRFLTSINQTAMNSHVMSLNIHPRPLKPFFYFQMNHLVTLNASYQRPICSYWDLKKYDGRGGWNSSGCRVAHWNQTQTSCQCTHLSNFAVLVQVIPLRLDPANKVLLSIFTYVGCALSIGGLVATIFVHFICRCFTERAKILLSLCVALLIAHSIFVGGITATHNRKACTAIACLLHYFYLAAFFWMLSNGIALFLKVRIVFKQGSKFVYYCLLGWGSPAVIVSISLGLKIDSYGMNNYCWLSVRSGLVWSFIGPVVAICIINLVVLLVVLKTFSAPAKLNRTIGPPDKSKKPTRSAVRAAFVLLPILGLGWLFGLFAVNKETLLFQYLFAATNSLQGFLIFLFHCLRNDEIRGLWHRQLHGPPSSTSYVSSSQPTSTEGSEASLQPRRGILKHCLSEGTYTAGAQNIRAQHTVTTVSSHVWDIDKKSVWLSLGCLLPGRSKIVPISKPKPKRANKKEFSSKRKEDKV